MTAGQVWPIGPHTKYKKQIIVDGRLQIELMAMVELEWD